MDPIDYVKKFRLITAISFFGFMVAAIVLMLVSILPRSPIIPASAIVFGFIPAIIFKLVNTVRCPRCGHKMKVYSKFPHVIYKCTKCSHVVNTHVDPHL